MRIKKKGHIILLPVSSPRCLPHTQAIGNRSPMYNICTPPKAHDVFTYMTWYHINHQQIGTQHTYLINHQRFQFTRIGAAGHCLSAGFNKVWAFVDISLTVPATDERQREGINVPKGSCKNECMVTLTACIDMRYTGGALSLPFSWIPCSRMLRRRWSCPFPPFR